MAKYDNNHPATPLGDKMLTRLVVGPGGIRVVTPVMKTMEVRPEDIRSLDEPVPVFNGQNRYQTVPFEERPLMGSRGEVDYFKLDAVPDRAEGGNPSTSPAGGASLDYSPNK